MSYVHPYSKRCEKSEIDLFSIPPTQLSLEKGRWIEYRPLSDVQTGDSAITYLISGTDEYIDLSKTILSVKGNVFASDGVTAVNTNVAPVNNFLHSLFKQVDVFLNGKQVTPAMGTYAYRSYIETLLNYDVSAKKSQLSSAMYYKDTAGKMEDKGALPKTRQVKLQEKQSDGSFSLGVETTITTAGTGNQGFAKRSDFIQDKKRFSLSGPIFSDVFMGDRLLLNGMTLKIVLNRSSNEFCLMDKNVTGINPIVKLEEVILKIRKVKVDQAVGDALDLLLLKSPAIYPIRRVECKFLTIPGGLSTTRKDNIFSGLIPKSFIFGLVDGDAFTGKTGKNPYNFKNFDVNNVGLSVNGEEIPFKQLTLTYPKSDRKDVDFIQAYNTLFSGTGKMYANMGLDISREDYPNGYTLYAFDLTPDMCNSTDYFNAVQRGSLSVDITFAEAANNAIAMVCYNNKTCP